MVWLIAPRFLNWATILWTFTRCPTCQSTPSFSMRTIQLANNSNRFRNEMRRRDDGRTFLATSLGQWNSLLTCTLTNWDFGSNQSRYFHGRNSLLPASGVLRLRQLTIRYLIKHNSGGDHCKAPIKTRTMIAFEKPTQIEMIDIPY